MYDDVCENIRRVVGGEPLNYFSSFLSAAEVFCLFARVIVCTDFADL